MNRIRISGWAAFALILLFVSGAPIQAQGGWSNYESDRYVVMTDGSAADAKEVLASMESMWGVYRFKQGLGGRVVRTVGAWDLPLQPLLYKLYAQVWPRVMDLLRARGRTQTRQNLEGDE